MERLVYHTLYIIAENSGYAEHVLDMTVPNIDGYDWKDSWSADSKSGPNSIIYHALDILAKKSNTIENVLDMVSMAPMLEGYDWRYLWDKKDN